MAIFSLENIMHERWLKSNYHLSLTKIKSKILFLLFIIIQLDQAW
jgi:hypothetical protein